jgi:hypothetical protein
LVEEKESGFSYKSLALLLSAIKHFFESNDYDGLNRMRIEKDLPSPAKQTLIMRYLRDAVVGQIQLEPYYANLMRRQKATGLSVEFYSLDGSGPEYGVLWTELGHSSSRIN